MSHIVEAKTSVKNPDLALLRQAVEVVARQHHGQIESYYLDFSGYRHPVNTGLALHVHISEHNQ